jgi:hypothetical protein
MQKIELLPPHRRATAYPTSGGGPRKRFLYQRVHEHAQTLFAQVEAETGVGLPEFVKAEFNEFARCLEPS